MRLTSLLATSLLVLLFSVPVFADDKHHEKQMDMDEMMKVWKKLATPGEPHKLLTRLEGSWTTKTKEWMEPGKPPQETSGSAEIKSLLGGRFIQQEFTGKMMGAPFSGVGIDGYDNLRKKYVTVWIDTFGTGIFSMEGNASPDGKTITLNGSHEMPGGGQMSHRAVWTVLDNNTFTFVMFGTHPGQDEHKVMEISYTRK